MADKHERDAVTILLADLTEARMMLRLLKEEFAEFSAACQAGYGFVTCDRCLARNTAVDLGGGRVYIISEAYLNLRSSEYWCTNCHEEGPAPEPGVRVVEVTGELDVTL